jgi:hypothetical protein
LNYLMRKERRNETKENGKTETKTKSKNRRKTSGYSLMTT